MVSRNLKVIDEHGIDRVANVICSFDVAGSDYILYWIERDENQDNLFVDKLIKNLDGTSSILNIDDENEKSRLEAIVKELVNVAVQSSDKVLNSNTVNLTNGKVVSITSVLINKEQNINVPKSYVASVQKSVTKVSEDYFSINKSDELNTSVEQTVAMPTQVNTVSPSINIQPEVVATTPVDIGESIPVDNLNVSTPVASEVVQESAMNNTSINASPVQEVSAMPEINIISSGVNVNPVPVESTPAVQSINNSVTSSPIAQVSGLDVQNVSQSVAPMPSVDIVPSIAPEPSESNIPNLLEPSPVPPIPQEMQNVQNRIVANNNPQSVVNFSLNNNNVSTPLASAPINTEVPQNDNLNNGMLVFDGSKESNLGGAFGNDLNNNTNNLTFGNNDLSAVREFGVDESSNSVSQSLNEGKTLVKTPNSLGFANNKFFMIIAIAFFVASCVFLGYEVFNYFSLK